MSSSGQVHVEDDVARNVLALLFSRLELRGEFVQSDSRCEGIWKRDEGERRNARDAEG